MGRGKWVVISVSLLGAGPGYCGRSGTVVVWGRLGSAAGIGR